MCVWPRADHVPELTLFFARPLCRHWHPGQPVPRDASRGDARRIDGRIALSRVALDGARSESGPSCWEKSHLWKKSVRHGLSTATLAIRNPAFRSSRLRDTRDDSCSFLFLLLPFESLTVDSAFFVARLLSYDRFFFRHWAIAWRGRACKVRFRGISRSIEFVEVCLKWAISDADMQHQKRIIFRIDHFKEDATPKFVVITRRIEVFFSKQKSNENKTFNFVYFWSRVLPKINTVAIASSENDFPIWQNV